MQTRGASTKLFRYAHLEDLSYHCYRTSYQWPKLIPSKETSSRSDRERCFIRLEGLTKIELGTRLKIKVQAMPSSTPAICGPSCFFDFAWSTCPRISEPSPPFTSKEVGLNDCRPTDFMPNFVNTTMMQGNGPPLVIPHKTLPRRCLRRGNVNQIMMDF
jgi:hypothetical protein